MYLIAQLGPSWQEFQCAFLFVCWCCCFPNGSSTAGVFILLSLLYNGFKLSLLLKPACPSASVQEMLMGPCMAQLTRLWPQSQRRARDGRRSWGGCWVRCYSQIPNRDAGAGKKCETSQAGSSCAEHQQGCVLFFFIHVNAVVTA